MPDRQAGFTLIEILVVLAILGAALGLFLARGPLTSPGLTVRDAASQLAQTFRLARTRAIAAARPVPVSIQLAQRRILLDGAATALPGSVSLAAVMDDGSAAAPTATFVFAPDGSARGGTVLVSAAGRRVGVAVDWLTGKVSVDAR